MLKYGLQASTPDIPAQMVDNTAEKAQAHESVFQIEFHTEFPIHPHINFKKKMISVFNYFKTLHYFCVMNLVFLYNLMNLNKKLYQPRYFITYSNCTFVIQFGFPTSRNTLNINYSDRLPFSNISNDSQYNFYRLP